MRVMFAVLGVLFFLWGLAGVALLPPALSINAHLALIAGVLMLGFSEM